MKKLKIFVAFFALAIAGLSSAAVFNLFQPATGILKGTATSYITTAASSADVLGVIGTVPVANGGTNLTSATDDTVPVGNGTTWQAKNLPDCQDTGGNHFNYNSTTNTFSCGTSSAGTSGSFSANYTGCNATVTATVNWVISPQNVVSVTLLAPSCTSNATTFTIDNWPANLRPSQARSFPMILLDNTTSIALGRILIQNSNTAPFGATAAANGGFTASGTKGFGTNALSFNYLL